MRRLLAVGLALAWLGNCAPVAEQSPTRASIPRASGAHAATATRSAAPVPDRQSGGAETVGPPVGAETPAQAARATRTTHAGILFEGVAWDERLNRLTLVDQAGGPGSRHTDAAAAGAARGGVAAVNAGFFTPTGAPLGLVETDGKQAGSWNSASSLGSGLWLRKADGSSAIARRESLGKSAAGGQPELLQAGPMLVENGRAVGGLEASKSALRVVLLWDGGHRWWIGRAAPCTLANLATTLATASPAGWPVRHALNLDGGLSTDLWVSEKISGGPISRRPPWHRQVRNFLVLLPR